MTADPPVVLEPAMLLADPPVVIVPLVLIVTVPPVLVTSLLVTSVLEHPISMNSVIIDFIVSSYDLTASQGVYSME